MQNLELKFNEIRKFCLKNRNEQNVIKYAKFFTEGYDAYGVDRYVFEEGRDKFLSEWKDELTIDQFFDLGDMLLSTGKYEEASFAIGFIYKQSDRIKKKHLKRCDNWLEKYIVNWGHTDILSGSLLPHFFTKKLYNIEVLTKWTTSKSQWKRRAIPVTFVELLKADFEIHQMLETIEPIMNDPEKKVQQGLGWFLREAWKLYPDLIDEFLLKWKETCGRTIIQYATEKMDKEYRLKFRKDKKKK